MVSPSEEAEDSGVTSAARGCADTRPTTGVGGASVPRRKGARIGRACNGSVGDQHVRKTHAADTNYAPHCDAPHCGPLIARAQGSHLSRSDGVVASDEPAREVSVGMPSETPRTISPEAENGPAVNVLLGGIAGGATSPVFRAFCGFKEDRFFAPSDLVRFAGDLGRDSSASPGRRSVAAAAFGGARPAGSRPATCFSSRTPPGPGHAEHGPRGCGINSEGREARDEFGGAGRPIVGIQMAKLIYSAISSLDGYVEDAHGKFDWAAPDDEVHAFVNDLERTIGTYL